MSDEITNKSRRCDGPSFEEIFKRHHRGVYYLCLCMTSNAAIAEELTQEVFVQVFRKHPSFRGMSSFSTWLYRMTVNQVLMHWRKNYVRGAQNAEDGALTKTRAKNRATLDRAPILDRIRLNDAIDRLPQAYRVILILHDVGGLKHAEIARVIGCPVDRSKSQLHKARMKLRQLLRPDESAKDQCLSGSGEMKLEIK